MILTNEVLDRMEYYTTSMIKGNCFYDEIRIIMKPRLFLGFPIHKEVKRFKFFRSKSPSANKGYTAHTMDESCSELVTQLREYVKSKSKGNVMLTVEEYEELVDKAKEYDAIMSVYNNENDL